MNNNIFKTARYILLAIAFAFASCANAQVSIQMEREGGVYKIPCKVNGARMKLIFDTGASNVCLSKSMAEYLLENDYISFKDLQGFGESSIADGSIVNHMKVNLKDVEIGGLHLNDVQAVVMFSQNAPLLLGQSAIQKLGTIQITGSVLTIKHRNSISKGDSIDVEFYRKRYKENMSNNRYHAALSDLLKIKDAIGLTERTKSIIIYLYMETEQYDRCIDLAEEWFREYEYNEVQHSKHYVQNRTSLFYSYCAKLDYDNAILNYELLLSELENGYSEYKFDAHYHFAVMLYNLKRFRETENYFRLAINDYCLQHKIDRFSVGNKFIDNDFLGRCMYYIACAKGELKDFNEANNYLKKSARCNFREAINCCKENNIDYYD